MRLDQLLLLSSVFLALVIACHALQNANRATAEDHCTAAKENFDEKGWLKAIEEYTMTAETYAWDATFLQESDVINAIEAYKRAAKAYGCIAVMARNVNLLKEAIEAGMQTAQLCKLAAQLCRQTSNIEEEASLHALAAEAYAKVAEIYERMAGNYGGDDDLVSEASAWFKAASVQIESANLFRSAGNTDNAIALSVLAAEAFIIAADTLHNTKSFDQEAEAWMRAAEANILSAWVYRQTNDALNGAKMYTNAASSYMAAAKAYTNTFNIKGITEAYQQVVTWRTIAAQMYHDERDHKAEARQYTETAHHHLTLNEHAQAGEAFELAAQARQHAQDYHAAVTMFQKAEKAFMVAKDPIAAQRVRSIVMACEAMTRVLYHVAAGQLLGKRMALSDQIELRIRRSHLLLDSYKAVMKLVPYDALRAEYIIVFRDEMGEDHGGLSREWFSLLAKEMINSKHAFFVTRNPSDQTYQLNPNKNSEDDLLHYHFFGRVLAMAINSGNLVHFRLADALLKHMLQQPVVFDDLCTFDPVLYHSYDALKRMTDLSKMDLFFAVHIDGETIELCPDGNNVPLTLDNRDEYIHLVTNYYLTRQIQAQLNAFLDGFHRFVHRDCIATLNTRALTWLINGESALSVDDWEQNTLYEGYSATSMPVIWFWKTVRSFSPEQHAKLLQFATGSSLVPLGGFSKLHPKFTIAKINQGNDHVPSAATCFRKLNLPDYSTEAMLRDKLLYAIEDGHDSFDLV